MDGSFLKSKNPKKLTKTINNPSWNFSVTSPVASLGGEGSSGTFLGGEGSSGTSLGREGSSGTFLGGEGSSGTSLGEEGSFESILVTVLKAFSLDVALKELRCGTEKV